MIGKGVIRNPEELELMRQSGVITAKALKKVIESVKPGVSLLELDRIADEEMIKLGAGASFKTVPGYYHATCLNVNEGVVHGLPTEYQLQEGDTVAIDLGAVFKGWHTDAAWTVVVGEIDDPKINQFLAVGEEAMWSSIKQAKAGNQIGDISSEMQRVVEQAGFSVVRSLTGHGVGRSGHEAPEIPTFGKAKTGLELQSGMCLAIEAIYTEGDGSVEELEDGWTISSSDHTRGGLFEMTVIVTDDGPEILTDWRKV